MTHRGSYLSGFSTPVGARNPSTLWTGSLKRAKQDSRHSDTQEPRGAAHDQVSPLLFGGAYDRIQRRLPIGGLESLDGNLRHSRR